MPRLACGAARLNTRAGPHRKCKPLSLPPPPQVGQYRKNTVMGVMEAEHLELGELLPTYRCAPLAWFGAVTHSSIGWSTLGWVSCSPPVGALAGAAAQPVSTAAAAAATGCAPVFSSLGLRLRK